MLEIIKKAYSGLETINFFDVLDAALTRDLLGNSLLANDRQTGQ